MPLHPRTLMRRAARTRLLNKTPALANVRTTNQVSYALEELPALAIYTDTEEVDEDSMGSAPRELKRQPELKFKASLKQTDDFVALHEGELDDALDAFALMIEDEIAVDETLGGTASDVVLARTELTIDESGDQLIGAIVLTYKAIYFRHAPQASPTDLFDVADVRHSFGNAVHPDNQAHDALENLYTI